MRTASPPQRSRTAPHRGRSLRRRSASAALALALVSSLAALTCHLTLASAAETVLVTQGTALRYLANASEPGLGMQWAGEDFDDSSWLDGAYGVGYETGTGAQALLSTHVPAGSLSIYTRAAFNIPDAAQVQDLWLGADYDDGYVAWINGVEVFRSAEMPAGVLDWSSTPGLHESSNGATPDYGALADISLQGISALHDGVNILAVGVWNGSSSSSDLVLVPRLSMGLGTSVTRGPYLQSGTPTSVTVRWRTATPTDSCVRYGAAPGSLTASLCRPGLTTEHVVELTGLAAGATYFYSVGTSVELLEGGDSSYVFKTPPASGDPTPVRVWVVGDSGTASADARAVRDAYERFAGTAPTDLWIMLGDNAYPDGTDGQYQAAVFDMYPEMLRSSVLWPTLGNHDAHTADSATQSGPYYDIFTLPRNGEAGGVPSGTEAYYSFDHGNVHFICLDSQESNRSSTGTMMTWLEQDLQSTAKQWIIAFWHHPPYSKGTHDSDVETQLIEMRQNALPILEQHGVDLVLTGHSHSYERSFLLDGHYGPSSTFSEAMKKDGGDGRIEGTGAYEKPSSGPAPHEGAVYLVAGCSGEAKPAPLNHPAMRVSMVSLGSLVLDVDGSRLDARFLDAAGVERDHFTLLKGTAPPTDDVNSVVAAELHVIGNVVGSHVDTWASDNVYETIEEVLTWGRRSTKTSLLEHKWTFDVQPGSSVTFQVEAHHGSSRDGDHFVFAYSTDDIDYTDMLTVTKTSDDGQHQAYALPPSIEGPLFVRVRDTNRTPGTRSRDTLYVDHLLVQTVR